MIYLDKIFLLLIHFIEEIFGYSNRKGEGKNKFKHNYYIYHLYLYNIF